MPLLCYLLYSHTPGTGEGEAEHDVTHIYFQQRAEEVGRVEQREALLQGNSYGRIAAVAIFFLEL